MGDSETRRYGLIGAGMMGQEHIRSLALVPGAELVAVADPFPKARDWTAGSLALTGQEAAFYEDWRDLAARDDLDAVVVATPNHTHHAIVRAFADTEIGLLVEKPLATTLDDAADLARLAKDRRAPIAVGLEYRYMPPVARFIDRAHAGEHGASRMLSIREHRFPFLKKVGDWNRFNANTGGTFVEKCCHFFDLMRLILRDEPVRVYASAGQDVNHKTERYDGRAPDILDNGFVTIDFAGGARAMLDLCMFAEGAADQEEISLVGETGRLEVKIPASVVTWSPRDKSGVLEEKVGVPQDALAAGHHHGATVFHLQDFHRALVAGRPPTISALDGLRSVEMGLAAQRSAATGEAVAIELTSI